MEAGLRNNYMEALTITDQSSCEQIVHFVKEHPARKVDTYLNCAI